MPSNIQLLQSLHQQTEQFLQKAIGEWQMLPEEVLAKQPSPEKWSAAQCLEHLNIYGRHYLPAIDKAIRATPLDDRSKSGRNYKSGWLGAYFTQLMQPSSGGGLKSKMKSPKNAVPTSRPDGRAMLAEFIDQQETMLKLLEAAKPVNLETVRVPTSLSPLIRLQLGDTFSFVIAHIERHILQAERALQAEKQMVS